MHCALYPSAKESRAASPPRLILFYPFCETIRRQLLGQACWLFRSSKLGTLVFLRRSELFPMEENPSSWGLPKPRSLLLMGASGLTVRPGDSWFGEFLYYPMKTKHIRLRVLKYTFGKKNSRQREGRSILTSLARFLVWFTCAFFFFTTCF